MHELMTCTRSVAGQPCDGTIDPDGFCNRCGRPVDRRQRVELTEPSRRVTTRRTSSMPVLTPIPPVEPEDPRSRVLADPSVPTSSRICRCGRPIGRRGPDGGPPVDEGICSCGRPFSFRPRLAKGDLVGGQYKVEGCLAHGGMGWVYLARDRNLDDSWVVLKGLLNSEDLDAAEAAIAERTFLIELKHPNIVQILNFVSHDGIGYIVMEYLPGRSLRDLRTAVDGHRVMPPKDAIGYLLEVFPALKYLHEQGFLYCDFKPENIISSPYGVKLIDLGAVCRAGSDGVHFSTPGFQAPEILSGNPTVASDLYTVGRTLAKLCTDVDLSGEFAHRLPDPERTPLFSRFDSLYRFLRKATADKPSRRFSSAAEMETQLWLIQHEVVAADQQDLPSPRSTNFLPERHAATERADAGALPELRDSEDISDVSVAAGLRAGSALIEANNLEGAEELFLALDEAVPGQWRITWMLGVLALRRADARRAREAFDAVYSELPGELAPRLALAFAAEQLDDFAAARGHYERVWRTSRSMTSAAFGLARCLRRTGDRPGALEAYAGVERTSHAWTAAQVARVRLLIEHFAGMPPEPADILQAGDVLGRLELPAPERAALTRDVLTEALRQIETATLAEDADRSVAGCSLTTAELRRGLEGVYRELARYAPGRRQKIELVDLANRVRPWSRL